MNLSFDRNTISIAKALVISSVVLGHILEAIILDGRASHTVESFYHVIYLVHMPFYFFLSGWLFKGAQPTVQYLIKKSKHLLLPYAAWLLLFNLKAIAGFAVNLFQGQLNGEKLVFYKEHFYAQLYGGMEVHGYLMILWFPMCLFFTQQFANVILNKFERQIPLVILISLGSYALAYTNQFFEPEFHLPLALNVVAGALPLFFIGYYLKNKPLKGFIFWTVVVSCVITCILIFAFSYPLTFHMRSAKYGIPFISTISALGGFFIILLLSRQLARNGFLYSLLEPLSIASMSIMYLHAFFLVAIRGLNITNIYLLLIFGLLIPTLIHLSMRFVPILSKVFLGETGEKIKISNKL